MMWETMNCPEVGCKQSTPTQPYAHGASITSNCKARQSQC